MDKLYQLHTYDNGLRLITVPMSDTQTVTVQIMVGTGSRYEARAVNGVSHFLEHMMFKGTTKRPGTMDISHELDAIGAEYNAFTGKEYTGYYAKASTDHFEKILDVEADIFLNSKLEAAEVEKERGVIIQEINMYFDNPAHHVAELYEALIFGDQPLGWPISGPKETIASLPAEKLREYFNTHYCAENTVVAIAGKIDPEQAKEKVWQYFSKMRQQATLAPLPWAGKQDKPGLKIFNKATDQTNLCLGVRGYGLNDDRRHILTLMAVVLGGSMSSRLFTEVREKRGLAYHVSAGADCYLDVGDFTIFAGVENAKLTEALKVILAECQRLKNEPVNAIELQKAKDFLKGKMVINLESSDDQAGFYSHQELLKRQIVTPTEKIERWNKVTAAEIQAEANNLWQTNQLNLAIVGPFAEGDSAIYETLEV